MTHAAVRDGLIFFWVWFGILFGAVALMYVWGAVHDWCLARKEARRAKR